VRPIMLAVVVAVCVSCAAGHPEGSAGRAPRTAAQPDAPAKDDAPPQPFIVESLPSSIEVVDAATGHVASTIELGHGVGLAGATTNAAARTAYVENDPGRCSVRVDALDLRGNQATNGKRRVSRVASVRGRYVDSIEDHPALSPDGRYLALVLIGGPLSYVNGIGMVCAGPEQIVVLDLADHTRRVWTGWSTTAGPSDLQWAPDSHHLGYLVSGLTPKSAEGAYLLDTRNPGRSYLDAPRILPRGPVFWWHGREVVARDSVLYLVRSAAGRHRLEQIAGGLPRSVETVSVAENGNNLLIQGRGSRTWWWGGHRSHRIPDPTRGGWLEPTW
jgi:hypothetical protein